MVPLNRALVVSALALSGCSGSTDDSGPVPAELRLLSSASVTGVPGWLLADSIVVQALSAEGNPVEGVGVSWVGPGRIQPASQTTDATGRVAAAWTLGHSEELQFRSEEHTSELQSQSKLVCR